jgi:hypothetical protein
MNISPVTRMMVRSTNAVVRAIEAGNSRHDYVVKAIRSGLDHSTRTAGGTVALRQANKILTALAPSAKAADRLASRVHLSNPAIARVAEISGNCAKCNRTAQGLLESLKDTFLPVFRP